MKEQITTRFMNEDNVLEIEETFFYGDAVGSINLIIGRKYFGHAGISGESIILSKEDIKQLIEKLQIYLSRIENNHGRLLG